MSAYDNDPRVAGAGSGTSFKVDLSGLGYDEPGVVWLRGDGSWVASRDHGSYPQYGTADEAIYALIGDPK